MQIEDNYLDIQISLLGSQSFGNHQTNSYLKKYMNIYDEHGVSSA